MNLSDMFAPATQVTPTPTLPGSTPLGDLIERLLVAEMPKMSAWALRPLNFPFPYKNYDQATSAWEPVGTVLGSRLDTLAPLWHDGVQPPANVNNSAWRGR